jgi:hypothetical protein
MPAGSAPLGWTAVGGGERTIILKTRVGKFIFRESR